MPGFPRLIEEDVQAIDHALDELLRKTEAIAALAIDKGGPVVSQRGETSGFDVMTTAALAAGSFCAAQAIAERVGEPTFNSIYQQGETHSLLVTSVETDLLLIVIFRASLSVGVVRYFAASTISELAQLFKIARERGPDTGIDLVSLNVVDASVLFRKKAS